MIFFKLKKRFNKKHYFILSKFISTVNTIETEKRTKSSNANQLQIKFK